MYDPIRRTYEDMPALKYKVELNESERTHLKEIASRGETSARKVKPSAGVAEGRRRSDRP